MANTTYRPAYKDLTIVTIFHALSSEKFSNPADELQNYVLKEMEESNIVKDALSRRGYTDPSNIKHLKEELRYYAIEKLMLPPAIIKRLTTLSETDDRAITLREAIQDESYFERWLHYHGNILSSDKVLGTGKYAKKLVSYFEDYDNLMHDYELVAGFIEAIKRDGYHIADSVINDAGIKEAMAKDIARYITRMDILDMQESINMASNNDIDKYAINRNLVCYTIESISTIDNHDNNSLCIYRINHKKNKHGIRYAVESMDELANSSPYRSNFIPVNRCFTSRLELIMWLNNYYANIELLKVIESLKSYKDLSIKDLLRTVNKDIKNIEKVIESFSRSVSEVHEIRKQEDEEDRELFKSTKWKI